MLWRRLPEGIILDDPPGFPHAPPGVDVLEGGKFTSNNVASSSHDIAMQSDIALDCVHCSNNSPQIRFTLRRLRLSVLPVSPLFRWGSTKSHALSLCTRYEELA